MILSDKQKKFCDEYLIDLNATQAAIRTGYSKKTAKVQAARLLTNVNLQKYIQDRQIKIQSKLEITQERIVKEYSRIAFGDIRNYYDDNSLLKSVHKLDEDSAAALAGIEVDELWGASVDGKMQIGETKKIKRWDKIRALDSLCKVLGYNAPDKVKLDATEELVSLYKTVMSRK